MTQSHYNIAEPTPVAEIFKDEGLKPFDAVFVSEVITDINEKMARPAWREAKRCGSGDDVYWSFVFDGFFSGDDSRYLHKAFTGAGWPAVSFTNHTQDGDAGTCVVYLYRTKKARTDNIARGETNRGR